MICPRLFLLPAAIVAMILSSSSAFKVGSEGRVMWQNNCDFYGGDIYSIAGIPDVCGDLCVNDSDCSHWSWTSFNGGTCWLKNAELASVSMRWGKGCGYVIARVFSSDSTDQTNQKPAEQNATPTKRNTYQKASQANRPSLIGRASQTSKVTVYNNGLTSAETAEMLASINSYRTDNGLAALTIDARLIAASLVHSQDQATHCTMVHEGTDGSDPWDRMEDQGYDWSVAAENVASGQTSVSAVMDSWWKSASHRANILKDDVENVGFALVFNNACSEYKSYWTQDFGTE